MGIDPSSLLSASETTSGEFCLFLASWIWERYGHTGASPTHEDVFHLPSMKMIKSLKHLSYKERLMELDDLKKRRPKQDLINSWWDGVKKMEPDSVIHWKERANGHKFKYRKFYLNIKKKKKTPKINQKPNQTKTKKTTNNFFFMLRVAWKGCGVSILGLIQSN